MQRNVTPIEAQAALDRVERGHLRVVDEIDLPRWYWWGLAVCWVGLGVVADLGQPWIWTAAVFTFGTVHAAVAPRAVSGRHRTRQLSVRADVAGRQAPKLVIGGVLLLTGVTIAVALGLDADGARHPALLASAFVAVVIVLGGPRLLDGVRARAARAATSS